MGQLVNMPWVSALSQASPRLWGHRREQKCLPSRSSVRVNTRRGDRTKDVTSGMKTATEKIMWHVIWSLGGCADIFWWSIWGYKDWDKNIEAFCCNFPLAGDQLGLHSFSFPPFPKIWLKFWWWERNSANNVGAAEPVGWIWFTGRCESYHGHKPNRNFGSSTYQTRSDYRMIHVRPVLHWNLE